MATPARSFCELDLTPALTSLMVIPARASGSSPRWLPTIRDHVSRCPACALRLAALDRLASRLERDAEAPLVITAVRAVRPSGPSRLVRAVLGPIRRTAAVAALGVGALFLGLAVGGGLTLGLAAVSDVPIGFHMAWAAGSSADDRSRLILTPGEAQARELASHGDPTPLRLILP